MVLISICSTLMPAPTGQQRHTVNPPPASITDQTAPHDPPSTGRRADRRPTQTAPTAPPPSPSGYLCEFTVAEHGSPAWVVARTWTTSPRIALRWLQQQASRVADLIDPDPIDALWAPVTMLDALDDDRADTSTALRQWPNDVGEHDQALKAMREGVPYTFTTTDDRLRCALSAKPNAAPEIPSAEPVPQLTKGAA